MAAVDRMSGGQFEKYCEDLLPHCGYPGARRVGHLKGQQAVDVTARTRAGTLLAIECRRQKISVQPKVVNALVGAITGRFLAYETTGMPAPPYGLVPSHLRCC